MKFENRKAQKKILLRLLGAALLLLFVLKTALDGFSVVTLWLVLVGIGFLAQKGSPVIVENVLTEIQFDKDAIRIIYRDLDRHDGKGKRKEIYDMGSRDIVQGRLRKISGRPGKWTARSCIWRMNRQGNQFCRIYMHFAAAGCREVRNIRCFYRQAEAAEDTQEAAVRWQR